MLDLTRSSAATQRSSLVNRTDVLDKVGTLQTLPDNLHVTTEMAASFYETTPEAVRQTVVRNRDEFDADGYRVLRRDEVSDKLSLTPEGVGMPKNAPTVSLFPRRAVLRLGMLLRDSPVARKVRDYLLDVETHHTRTVSELFDQHMHLHSDGVEYVSAREIAQTLDISWSAMQSRLHASRRRVQRAGLDPDQAIQRYELPRLPRTIGRPPVDYWVTRSGLSYLVLQGDRVTEGSPTAAAVTDTAVPSDLPTDSVASVELPSWFRTELAGIHAVTAAGLYTPEQGRQAAKDLLVRLRFPERPLR